MITDTPASRLSTDLLSPLAANEPLSLRTPERSPVGRRSVSNDHAETRLNDHVRATLSPSMPSVSGRSSPRLSSDIPREDRRRSLDLLRSPTDKRASSAAFDHRRSFDDRGRRSTSLGRMSTEARQASERSGSRKLSGLSEPSESFIEPSMTSSGPNISSDDFQSSASQILSRSDVFRPNKVNRFADSPDQSEDESSKRVISKDASSIKTQHPIPSRSATPKVLEQTQPRTSVDSSTSQFEKSQDLSTQALRGLVKAGQYPLHKATNLAGYLSRNSRKMSSLLATESMSYVEKVSGMWAGGRRHYPQNAGDAAHYADDDKPGEDDVEEHTKRFRAHFALPDSERLQATYFGFLHRVLPLYGKIYISERYFCFRSLLPGTKTKMILPLKDIENVDKEKGFR